MVLCRLVSDYLISYLSYGVCQFKKNWNIFINSRRNTVFGGYSIKTASPNEYSGEKLQSNGRKIFGNQN